MSTIVALSDRVKASVMSRFKIDDPLVASLTQKAVGTTLALAAVVVIWLALTNLLFTRVIFAPRSATPGADLVLEAASESIDEVVRFAGTTEPIAAEVKPEEAYPDEIDVHPLATGANPFLVAQAPATAPAGASKDLAALIRKKQAEAAAPVQVSIDIRGILARGQTYLAILASEGVSRVVRTGETFMDWQVLAVGRDRVVLKKDGKTRTIVWEGSK